MKHTYSPREFGLLINRTTNTLQRWDRAGILKANRTPTNRRYYTHEQYLQVVGQKAKSRKLATYCRVASAGQKKDLQSQRNAVEMFCIELGRTIEVKFEDVGSGLNYKRKNFLLLMEMVERGEISEIVVAHKDRLVRFGFEWFEKFCYDHGVKILVMNTEAFSPEEEMTKDLAFRAACMG